MNKKGQLVALLSLFLVVGLIASLLIVSQSSDKVIRMFFTPTDILNQHFEIKEYELDLNQKAKYCSFEAFDKLAENSGFFESERSSVTGSVVQQIQKCEDWSDCNPLDNLEINFERYFVDCFEPFFDLNVEIVNDNFKISGKYQDKKIFEFMNVRTEVKPEFEYVLEDYEVNIFENLYNTCKNVLNCDDLKECKVNKCSSKDKYINMEYNLKDNGFIQPKILFKIRKPEVL